MNGSCAASAPMRLITAAAAGPCSASRARSSCAMKLHAGRQVGGDVGEVDLLAAGVDHEEQPLVAEVGHHQVVEDAACLVGQQRVALPARLQARACRRAPAAPARPPRRRRSASPGPCARHRTAPPAPGSAGARPARPGTAPAWRSRRTAPCGRRTRGARRRAAWSSAAWASGSSGRAFSITGPLRKGHAPALGAGVADPPLSRDLKDSGRAGRPLPRRCGRRVARLPAFQRSLIPPRSLLPERFRGPVAPSAAEATPLSPAPGGWDGRKMPERASIHNGGFGRIGPLAPVPMQDRENIGRKPNRPMPHSMRSQACVQHQFAARPDPACCPVWSVGSSPTDARRRANRPLTT